MSKSKSCIKVTGSERSNHALLRCSRDLLVIRGLPDLTVDAKKDSVAFGWLHYYPIQSIKRIDSPRRRLGRPVRGGYQIH